MRPVSIFGTLALALGAALGISSVALRPGHEACFSERCYVVEFAVDAEAREQGLSGRSDLCARCAMLFVFPEDGRYGFWMKDMRFPLDIVWIDQNGVVVHVERNLPPDADNVYVPASPARYVLELNANEAKDVGNGDTWRLPDRIVLAQ